MTFDRTSMMLLSGLDITMAYKCHSCISLNNRGKNMNAIFTVKVYIREGLFLAALFQIIIILIQSKIKYKSINTNYNVEEKAMSFI